MCAWGLQEVCTLEAPLLGQPAGRLCTSSVPHPQMSADQYPCGGGGQGEKEKEALSATPLYKSFSSLQRLKEAEGSSMAFFNCC